MRLTYMLDANVLVHLANKSTGWERIESRFKDTPFDVLCMSSIAFFELSAMHEKGRGKIRAASLAALQRSMSLIKVLPYTAKDAAFGGLIDAGLSATGKTIGKRDSMIAGHAAMRGLILVTDNTKEFDRVPLLKLENWRLH
jgi:tRNA(fMet)-specific endonuclease VapC